MIIFNLSQNLNYPFQVISLIFLFAAKVTASKYQSAALADIVIRVLIIINT